ncbi:MAG TPA: CpsB/CapC family capsule biosynthesis tyrosine phosphatase [Solirubrobacteraceae bacterium]
MNGLVDIHAHILPELDDGPGDLEEALAMARTAVAAGIGTIVSTPHLRSDFPDVHLHEFADRCQRMRTALQSAAIPLRLVCGAEVSLEWALEASHEELVLASIGQNGTDLLIETPTVTVSGLDMHLFQLHKERFRVTLAHPERSPDLQSDPEHVEDLVRQGVLLQVNAGSLLEVRRKSDRGAFARRLCELGLVHALASDGHRAESWRPVRNLPEGLQVAESLLGCGRAQWMTRAAPQAIVDGTELPDPPAISVLPRRKLFGRRR